MIPTAALARDNCRKLAITAVIPLLIILVGCGREPGSFETTNATHNLSVPAIDATIGQPKEQRPESLDLEAVLANIPEDTAPLRQRLQERLEVSFAWEERDDGKVLVAQLGFQKSLGDSDLIALAGLDGPLNLLLSRTAITDAGLALLARMRRTQRQGRPLLGEIQHLHLDGTRITNQGLTQLAAFDTLRTLDLSNTQITDAGLAYLSRLSQLQRLYLCRTTITGAGLVRLQPLSALRELDLELTALDDEGLQQLPLLPNLRKLVLRNTRVSDSGLERLKVLPVLEELDLTGTRITDACVAAIKELKRLRHLRIADKTELTERGAIQLRLALPDHVRIE